MLRHLFTEPGVNPGEFRIEPFEFAQRICRHPLEMRIGPAVERQNQVRNLAAQMAECFFCQHFRTVHTAGERREHCAAGVAGDVAGYG